MGATWYCEQCKDDHLGNCPKGDPPYDYHDDFVAAQNEVLRLKRALARMREDIGLAWALLAPSRHDIDRVQHGSNCLTRFKTWAAADPEQHCDCDMRNVWAARKAFDRFNPGTATCEHCGTSWTPFHLPCPTPERHDASDKPALGA